MEDLLVGDRSNLSVQIPVKSVGVIGEATYIYAGRERESCGFFRYHEHRARDCDWIAETLPLILTNRGLLRWAVKLLTNENGADIKHQNISFALNEMYKGISPKPVLGTKTLGQKSRVLALAGVYGQPEISSESQLNKLTIGSVTLESHNNCWKFSEAVFSYEMATEFAAYILADVWTKEEDWRYYFPWLVRRPMSHWSGTMLAITAPKALSPISEPFPVTAHHELAAWLSLPGNFSWEALRNPGMSGVAVTPEEEADGQLPDGVEILNLLTLIETEDESPVGLHQGDGAFMIAYVDDWDDGDERIYRGRTGFSAFEKHEDLVSLCVSIAREIGFSSLAGRNLGEVLPAYRAKLPVRVRKLKEDWQPKTEKAYARVDLIHLPESFSEQELFALVCQVLSDPKTESAAISNYLPQLSAFLLPDEAGQVLVIEEEHGLEVPAIEPELTLTEDVTPSAVEVKETKLHELVEFHPQVRGILERNFQDLERRLKEGAGV